MSGHSKKVFLFVDGTNLYAGQHELFGTGKYLDFAIFIKVIELNERDLVSVIK